MSSSFKPVNATNQNKYSKHGSWAGGAIAVIDQCYSKHWPRLYDILLMRQQCSFGRANHWCVDSVARRRALSAQTASTHHMRIMQLWRQLDEVTYSIYILYIYNITKKYRKPGKKCKKHESMSRGYKGFWQHLTGVIANSLRRWVHWQSWLQRGDLLHSKLLPSKALRDPQTSTLSTLALLLKASQSCFVIFYW